MKTVLAFFSGLFTPVAGSIRGALIIPELVRAFVAGLAGSSFTAGLAIALNVIAEDAPSLTSSQALASFATFVLAQLAAVLAQLGQGAKVAAVAVPFDDAPMAVQGFPNARVELLHRSTSPDPRPIGTHAYSDPLYGEYKVQVTEGGPSGPIFQSREGFLSYQRAGRPQLAKEKPGAAIRIEPPFDKLSPTS